MAYLIVVTGLESVVDADCEGDDQHGTEDDVVDNGECQRKHFEEEESYSKKSIVKTGQLCYKQFTN